MRKIIKDRHIIEDNWCYLASVDASHTKLELPQGDIVVSLTDWQNCREQLLAHPGKLGLCLQSDEEPSSIKDDLEHVALIAIDFPKFSDGRGYSSARELRKRYAYTGEIRATGDVLRDQLYIMERCGFNAFEVREDRSLEEAISAFEDFSFNYQADTHNTLPSYRR